MNNWNPFFALENTRECVTSNYDNQNLIEKPELTEDKFCEIEELIQLSLQNKCEINVFFYKNGKINETYGIISKVDVFIKLIYINGKPIAINSIVNVKI